MNNDNDKQQFIMASIIERQQVKEFQKVYPAFDVWKFTSESGYCEFDCFVISGRTYDYIKDVFNDNRWAVEVKIRTFPIDKYDTAYIKAYKYYKMVSKCRTYKYAIKKVKPIYMMFFSDGYVALWNLFTAKKKYIEKEFDKYNCIKSEVVLNKLFELNINEATIYKWR